MPPSAHTFFSKCPVRAAEEYNLIYMESKNKILDV